MVAFSRYSTELYPGLPGPGAWTISVICRTALPVQSSMRTRSGSYTLYRRLRASYSYDRRASDSARGSSSDAVSRATRTWARNAMIAPPIPEAAPISATTSAVTDI